MITDIFRLFILKYIIQGQRQEGKLEWVVAPLEQILAPHRYLAPGDLVCNHGAPGQASSNV